MGASRRSAGEPLSMRSAEASVFVAKNWKMDSMQRALMSSQFRKPSAYATGFLDTHTFAKATWRGKQSQCFRFKVQSIPTQKEMMLLTAGNSKPAINLRTDIC